MTIAHPAPQVDCTEPITVTDQEGRGLRFCRGVAEVQEYLQQATPNDWERSFQQALAAQFQTDPTLAPSTLTVHITPATAQVSPVVEAEPPAP